VDSGCWGWGAWERGQEKVPEYKPYGMVAGVFMPVLGMSLGELRELVMDREA